MAYNSQDLYKKAMAAIKKNNLIFIEDVVAFLPCDKSTFYKYFPPESNEFNTLKEELERNRINIKSDLRKKWQKSDNPTLQIALYKTICSDDERRKLNTNYNEITGKNGEPLINSIKVTVVRDRKDKNEK